MDLLELLRQVPLFQSLSPDHLVRVSGLIEELTVAPGTYLSRQGELGATFYLVDEGQAIVQRLNDKGYEMPVGTIGEGRRFYGVTSLFVVVPRDATVIARTTMHLWVLNRPAFLDLLDEQPGIERELNIPPDVQARRQAPRYSWQAQGEQLAFRTHKHWIVFAQKMVWGTLFSLAITALLLSGATLIAEPLLTPLLLLPGLAVFGVVLAWNLVDWRNDYFAVTNRRISYREHVAFLYDQREDAPLDQVQNVNVTRDLLAQVLGYGGVTVQTAADSGTMRFRHVQDPEGLRKAIFDEQERAMATRHAEQRWKIRELLTRHVSVEQVAAGGGGQPAIEQPIDLVDDTEPPRQAPGGLRRVLDWVGGLEIIPPIRQQTPERVVWRKHWLFLVLSVFVPLVLFVVAAAFLLVIFMTGGLFGLRPGGVASLTSLAITLILFLWLVYRYLDWGNDRYIVTNDRIIDVEQRPFLLSSDTREASLGNIQNVHYLVPNIIASTLRYGDVIVQTAGAGEFTFTHVPNPADVQNEIFRRIHNYRLALQRRQAEDQRQELGAWFAEYDDLKGRRPSPELPEEMAEGPEPVAGDEPPTQTTI
jgi:uncharacterized membrane protein YdbT with pleckstrin-like domain